MTLKYYNAYLTIASTPSGIYIDSLQAVTNYQFENSPSYYLIEEEPNFGTQIFSQVGVRITHIIQSNTGIKISDDYKQVLFKDLNHTRGLGYRYRFNDNIWLTISSDLYKYPTASSILRRCNNTLKWKDSAGILYSEPCCIDYSIKYPNLNFNSSIIIPEGRIEITCQANDNTNKIKLSDKFILGHQGYHVIFMNNFLLNNTTDISSNKLIIFVMQKIDASATDDKINNIAISSTPTGVWNM